MSTNLITELFLLLHPNDVNVNVWVPSRNPISQKTVSQSSSTSKRHVIVTVVGDSGVAGG